MKNIFLLVFIIILPSTIMAQSYSTQKGGHCYTLDIPDYMTKTYTLNDVASMQYQNIQREAYTMVIEDEKAQLESIGIKFVDAADFLDQFIVAYMVDSENRKTSKATTFNSNGNPCAQLELEWNDEANAFYMLITVVETKTHFYKVMSWTLAENKDKLKYDFQKTAKSLKD
ncbi:MAG: hypothetical protein M9949_12070 [Candidatus Kapabacteria bacterium]|nr:hypothetical protein [Candidatus Kapabacteria bacterium]